MLKTAPKLTLPLLACAAFPGSGCVKQSQNAPLLFVQPSTIKTEAKCWLRHSNLRPGCLEDTHTHTHTHTQWLCYDLPKLHPTAEQSVRKRSGKRGGGGGGGGGAQHPLFVFVSVYLIFISAVSPSSCCFAAIIEFFWMQLKRVIWKRENLHLLLWSKLSWKL